MAHVEKQIEVDVPVRTAYNQWTQFEEFPEFMEGIQEVRQLDEARLHWTASVAGREKEWDARITEQVPDERVAWVSESGAQNDGVVQFQSIGPDRTLVSVSIDFEPEGLVENVGSALGMAAGRIEGDLERFKEFIETRGVESGAWRGQVEGGVARPAGSGSTPRFQSASRVSQGTAAEARGQSSSAGQVGASPTPGGADTGAGRIGSGYGDETSSRQGAGIEPTTSVDSLAGPGRGDRDARRGSAAGPGVTPSTGDRDLQEEGDSRMDGEGHEQRD